MSVAAEIAAPAPPPAARIATAVNCAEPAKTTSDMRIASKRREARLLSHDAEGDGQHPARDGERHARAHALAEAL